MFDLRQFADLAPDFSGRLDYHGTLPSTSDEARYLAEQGVGHGHVVLADHQTKGRGRRGAAWLSEPGSGLLFSVILRPDFARDRWSRIALAAGLGMAEALNDVWSLGVQVKWPNDIYLHERKCAGILAETYEQSVILGIGVNVHGAPGSGDVDARAIALDEVVSDSVTRENVLAVVLQGVMREVEACGNGFADQLSRLGDLFYLTGKDIEFTVGHEQLTGRVQGINDSGHLVVEMPGGVRSFSQASGIRVV